MSNDLISRDALRNAFCSECAVPPITDIGREDCRNVMNCSIMRTIDSVPAVFDFTDAAKKMHLWIFHNTCDEQEAYDECGLTDEENAMLGYGGQFVIGGSNETD